MPRISFKNDYRDGVHPRILKAIADHDLSGQEGYGLDQYSKEAAVLLQRKIKTKADIHFVSGGTRANLVVIFAKDLEDASKS